MKQTALVPTKKRKTKNIRNERDDDGDDDGDDESDESDESDVLEIKSFAQKFSEEAKSFKQTVKRNCNVCHDNKHRTTFFCLQCSVINEADKSKNELFWICSPCSDRSFQCYPKHVRGNKVSKFK